MQCIFNIYPQFTFSLTISSASMLTFNKIIANFQRAQLKYCLSVLLMIMGFVLQAQVTLSLTYTEKNNKTTILAGDFYTMQLNYSVSSTTGNASGVKAVINIPDFVHVVGGFVGTTDAPAGNLCLGLSISNNPSKIFGGKI
jgi:cytochrome c biogenesis protein CcdA